MLGWAPGDLAVLGAGRVVDLYLSEQVLEAEKEHVFCGSWFLVATTEELAAPGDYLATSVAGAPVLVVRGGDGQLAAYHNVCRHRGLTLAEGRGRLGRFLTCPYHQWSYRLDGSLANVPQEDEEFPGLDKSHWGLVPVALSEWQGMVFVRLSPEGVSLQASWGALGRHLGHFCRGPLVEAARVSYEAACNWKLLVENHLDVYHLWYLHARSLQAYAHTRFSWQVLGDNWWSHEPLKDPARAPVPPVALAWLDEAERTGIGLDPLFPNLMVVTTGRYFATHDAVPVTPGRTLLTLRIRVAARRGPRPAGGRRPFLHGGGPGSVPAPAGRSGIAGVRPRSVVPAPRSTCTCVPLVAETEVGCSDQHVKKTMPRPRSLGRGNAVAARSPVLARNPVWLYGCRSAHFSPTSGCPARDETAPTPSTPPKASAAHCAWTTARPGGATTSIRSGVSREPGPGQARAARASYARAGRGLRRVLEAVRRMRAKRPSSSTCRGSERLSRRFGSSPGRRPAGGEGPAAEGGDVRRRRLVATRTRRLLVRPPPCPYQRRGGPDNRVPARPALGRGRCRGLSSRPAGSSCCS